MPMCSWCGTVVSAHQVSEMQNGPAVLRLCPQCSHTEQGRKMTAALPRHVPREVDLDDEPRPPKPWLQYTAWVVLLAFVLPLTLALLTFYWPY